MNGSTGSGCPLAVYLSGTTARLQELRECARDLEADGMRVASSWLYSVSDEMSEAAARDLQDLHSADVLVAFTQGAGSAHRGRGGRHVELGVAIASRLTVVLVGESEHVFHHLPTLRRANCWLEARGILAELSAPADSRSAGVAGCP